MEIILSRDLIQDERNNLYLVVGQKGADTLVLKNVLLCWSDYDLIECVDGQATINDGKEKVRKAIDIINYRARLFKAATETNPQSKVYLLEDVMKEYKVEFTV